MAMTAPEKINGNEKEIKKFLFSFMEETTSE